MKVGESGWLGNGELGVVPEARKKRHTQTLDEVTAAVPPVCVSTSVVMRGSEVKRGPTCGGREGGVVVGAEA